MMISIVAMLSFEPVAPQEISGAKRKEIEKYLHLIRATDNMNQMIALILTQIKSNMHKVPDRIWYQFTNKNNPNEIIEKIIPLYDKYYTLEDLKAINSFIESPVGQKMVSTDPKITKESFAIGQEWGKNLARQIADEVKKESKENDSEEDDSEEDE